VIELSIVVPVHREGDAARPVIEKLAGCVDVPHEIVVVYDDADDPTLPVLEDLRRQHPEIRPLQNRLGPGPALALRAAFAHVVGDAVVVTMADASDDPADIPRMLARLREGCDLVAGSRYMPGGQQIGGPWLKSRLSRFAGRSLQALAGLPTADATSAFKMYRKAMLDRLTIESRHGFEISLEITVKALLGGYRIAEIPTVWRDRVAGRSKFRLLRWLPRYLRWYGLGLSRGMLRARH